MKILSIETSCDETAVAVTENGTRVLSNAIASQIAKHAETGGVVPEVAAREHIKAMIPTLRAAMREAGVTWKDIDAIAVTREPGLIGSLVVGRITAVALAFACGKPLIEVNHIHGHIYANWLETETEFPILTLTVSGGHNELVLMRGHGQMEIIAETVDDSAGEAFDKVARLLGLPYPGGPAIEARAALGNAGAFKFPIGMKKDKNFSFSGLKTSVFYLLKDNERLLKDGGKDGEKFVNDVAASFQSAAVSALLEKLIRAVKKYAVKEVHLSGGVSANKYLRAQTEKALASLRLDQAPVLRWPKKLSYCTDNAAMIGSAGYFMRANLSFINHFPKHLS
ncbi:MAG: tRNA (adenosine(37)-N6)-threonylcarbamoyltransferase complex transferase subunit TsaD [Candidatus Gracilibacteria bacterium]|jgi:N6-L-threonylcarbamoyladenine synthase